MTVPPSPAPTAASFGSRHRPTLAGLALAWVLVGCGGAGTSAAADPAGSENSKSTTPQARPSTPTPVPIPNRSRYVGTNLAGVAYWTTQFPFADFMKNGSGWEPQTDSSYTGPQPSTFASMQNGYPTALSPGQHAVSSGAWNGTHHPLGDYVVLWDGDGATSVQGEGVSVVTSARNRLVVRATTDDLMLVRIDRTNPADPVRNVRFLMPGTEATYATQPFNLEFLRKTAPFSSLRFMDWGMINNSPVVQWADRSQVGDVSYATDRGVPVEVMIDLANALQAEPWFCIPHQASDDYVKQLATLIHTRLDPALNVRIEYSNEMWNTSFGQTSWGLAQSQRLGLPTPNGTPSAFYSQRALQVFGIFQQVYGKADSKRLVRVMAGQAAWTQFQDNALGWKGAAASTDVVAIAPYFTAGPAGDPAQMQATLAMSNDQIIQQMLTSIRGEVKSWVVQNAALATKYHVKLEGYEAGFGNTTYYFPDGGAAMTPFLASVNRSARMRDVYNEYYGAWVANGGQLLNQYDDIGQWSKWGFWGALEFVGDDPSKAPKYQGLLDFIAAHP